MYYRTYFLESQAPPQNYLWLCQKWLDKTNRVMLSVAKHLYYDARDPSVAGQRSLRVT